MCQVVGVILQALLPINFAKKRPQITERYRGPWGRICRRHPAISAKLQNFISILLMGVTDRSIIGDMQNTKIFMSL